MPVTQNITFSATPPTTGENPTTFNYNAISCWDDLKNNIVPALNTAFGQLNEMEINVNAKEVSCVNSALSAASDSLLAAGAANNKGAWSLLTGALNIPSAVNHSGSIWILNRNIANVALSEPTPTNTDWTESSGITQQELDAVAGIATPTKAGVTTIVVDGNSLEMSLYVTPTAGLDYYFSKTAITTTVQADTIGGFHYSLVPHAEAPTGNKTEADMVKLRGINEYSIWTLWDRPICFDPRGKAKVGSRWYDIYLMDRDYGIRGYSAPTVHTGANIAAGVADATYFRQIPKIPLAYGGDGTVTYGKYTWFQACEVATATGNQNISYNEFPTIAYGVLEGVGSTAYGDDGTIFHIPQLMSKYGIEMATGTEYVWGADLANGYGTTTFAWVNNTDTRGQIYATSNAPVAVVLGGDRTRGVYAGSRASAWDNYVWYSHWSVGSRFACDSLEHA